MSQSRQSPHARRDQGNHVPHFGTGRVGARVLFEALQFASQLCTNWWYVVNWEKVSANCAYVIANKTGVAVAG
jgi:hypothetical protein